MKKSTVWLALFVQVPPEFSLFKSENKSKVPAEGQTVIIPVNVPEFGCVSITKLRIIDSFGLEHSLVEKFQ